MNPTVDTYLSKATRWQKELSALRTLLLDCGLTEELKWGSPCYRFQKSNVAIIGELKECCVLSFFKGALLGDPEGLLIKPGEHTQAARMIRFTDVQEIYRQEAALKAYIYEAIEVEKAGLQVDFSQATLPVPEEFQRMMAENPALKTAFEALTPGRRRAYLLHFSEPKQAKTRQARIEKCLERILNGIGLLD